ncbi:MAG TPA: hypothetical protein VGO03_16835 [Acidimicrobiia bacterium]|jgi:hypothetical protein
MDPINEVLLGVMADTTGDTVAAREHLAAAQRHWRTGTRRHRQIIEIASLVVAGSRERAEGLSLVHAAEFPEDADLLARITDESAPGKGASATCVSDQIDEQKEAQ